MHCIRGGFTEREIQVIAVQVLKGLCELHDHEKCHRDIKHENILINFPTHTIRSEEDQIRTIKSWDVSVEPIEVFITDFGTTRDLTVQEDGEARPLTTSVAGSMFAPGERK